MIHELTYLHQRLSQFYGWRLAIQMRTRYSGMMITLVLQGKRRNYKIIQAAKEVLADLEAQHEKKKIKANKAA